MAKSKRSAETPLLVFEKYRDMGRFKPLEVVDLDLPSGLLQGWRQWEVVRHGIGPSLFQAERTMALCPFSIIRQMGHFCSTFFGKVSKC